MAQLIIPVRHDFPAYTFSLDLEGKTYFFAFRYNQRMDRWVMDIADENEAPILVGVVVFPEIDLTGRFMLVRPTLPPGLFMSVDFSGKGEVAHDDNFGDDLKLLYLESTTEL